MAKCKFCGIEKGEEEICENCNLPAPEAKIKEDKKKKGK